VLSCRASFRRLPVSRSTTSSQPDTRRGDPQSDLGPSCFRGTRRPASADHRRTAPRIRRPCSDGVFPLTVRGVEWADHAALHRDKAWHRGSLDDRGVSLDLIEPYRLSRMCTGFSSALCRSRPHPNVIQSAGRATVTALMQCVRIEIEPRSSPDSSRK
jgi:hypothetical protein